MIFTSAFYIKDRYMRNKKKLFAGMLSVFMAAFVLFATHAYALDAGVYTAYMTAHYAHPQTGVVEDSGGEKSMAIGQGMCEGATSRDALIEKAANGQMYATVRYVLMDAVQGAEFRVNGIAVSSEVTQKEGQNWDFRIPIPDENCVVRGNMYVEPMGRDVVFYMTFSDFKEGHGDFITKISDQDLDPLFDDKNNAAQQISSLEYLNDDEESAFRKKIDECTNQEEIDSVLHEANEADREALAQLELGKAKSSALKTIDSFENLDQSKIKELRDDVKEASSIEEVDKVVDKAKQLNNDKSIYIVGAVVIAAVVIIIVKSRRKAAGDASSQGDGNVNEKE